MLVDRNAEAILEMLPRLTINPYHLPKLGCNAFVCVDAAGRLNILTTHGLLTIDEEDLNVLDSEEV